MDTNSRLQGKIAVITGAANGIGKQSALLFANAGATVVIADINSTAGEEVVAEINASGSEALFIFANLSKPSDCQNLITATINRFGRIDILFNNVAIMHPLDGNIVTLDEKIWEKTFGVNLNSTFWCCKYAIPYLLQSGDGVILNVTSIAATKGSANSKMAYAASKSAILSLTRHLAIKYANSNIRVNAICPGPTATESFIKPLNQDQAKKSTYLSQIPLRRFANPREIAQAALFLVSNEASFITGTELVVDGGITATYLTLDI